MGRPIPAPLVALVAGFCAEQERHASLDSLLTYAEATGDPPAGSKPVKAPAWLRETNKGHPSRCWFLGNAMLSTWRRQK